jgi:type IV pilus assembly protein PilV
MIRPPATPRRSGAGFTLVEVLVALVVMSVGMLGIAALYVEGLRAGRTAVLRTTAVTLAADMADRIRANPQALAAYAGAGPGADNACVNGPAPCSAAAMAADDWQSWSDSLQTRLPAGAAAEITVTDLPPLTRYAITLTWPETGQAEPASYTLVFER